MFSKSVPMLVWAARENLRQPGWNVLTAGCLAGLTLALAAVLLVTAALERTTVQLLYQGPDLVVRRLDTTGWQPLPVGEAMAAVGDLPGINQVRPRVWGLVQSDDTSVTVVGADSAMRRPGLPPNGMELPARGHALVGGWWRQHGGEASLTLNGHRKMHFKIDSVLPPEVDLAAYDTVLLNVADARELLGIAEGWASDLALDVFHPGEAEALRPEIREALAWPVTIRTRTEALNWYRSGFGRRSSLVVMLWLPAITALGLVVLAVVQRQAAASYPAGLLKALGWTTSDIVRLYLYQALITAIPSITLGLALAYSLVGGPFTDDLARILLGWRTGAPARTLAPGANPLVFMAVGAFVLLPYLSAMLWPALKTAAVDTDALLNQEG